MPHASRILQRAAHQRAFTLVELMVAITGGLFVSIIVFTLAKNSARFYQSETRIGEATLGSVVGFERLRADIARAGFLASPNIQSDPRVCGGMTIVNGFPDKLKTLTSLQISPGATQAVNNANLKQDRLLITGSFSSVDYFPMRVFAQTGTGPAQSIFLNPFSAALQRLGYPTDASSTKTAREDVLRPLFKAGRVIRIVDRSDRHYYALIAGINADTLEPEIQLAQTPKIPMQGELAGGFCGMDQCTGCVVNIVNFIQYDVTRLNPTTYAPIYDDAGTAPFDETRTELKRVELDVNGNEMQGTEELVTQYAVDLKFGFLVEDRAAGIPLKLVPFDDDHLTEWAGPPPGLAQRIRGVRVRLGVRSREADRETDITPEMADEQGLPPGLYRVGLGGTSGREQFARVRTLQADVALNNQTSISW